MFYLARGCRIRLLNIKIFYARFLIVKCLDKFTRRSLGFRYGYGHRCVIR